MKPSATNKWLLASVIAVLWAIATTIVWALLTLAFGRSKSDSRLITVLILGAVVAAFLGAHAYSQGWKAGSKASLSGRKEPNP
jgi:steroid 5-alpha reductase family enzyme